MKKILFTLLLIFASCIVLSAQKKDLSTVTLQDGTKIKANVEKQTSGGYKLTTEDGTVFFFNENEIKSVVDPIAIDPNTKLKYWELKKMYSAKDYHGRERGDKYSPAAVGVASFLIPGLGQYITGTNVGWGVLQTAASACAIYFSFRNNNPHPEWDGSYRPLVSWDAEIGVPVLAAWLGIATWSCCSAVKAAKIKNLYYRDVKNGVAYKFDIAPYIDFSSPTLASNSNPVAGISLKISF